MKVSYGDSKKVVDYVFWIVLIFFTNPGSILQAFGEDVGDGGVKISDFLFVVLSICFVLIFKKKYFQGDSQFLKVSKFLFIFLIYYVIVVSFFIPQFKSSQNYSFIFNLIKIRPGIMNFFLVHYVYLFYLRSYKLFLKYFILSSIIVLILFLSTVFTGLDILPIKTMDRKFITIERQIMYSYGLMPLITSMGAVLLVFKNNLNSKKLILVAFILMSSAWVLSLFRREIFGTIILFFVTALVHNYIKNKNLIPFKKIVATIFYVSFFLFIIKLTFPNYLEAIRYSLEETVNVFMAGETSTGKKDVRLGFGKPLLQEKIAGNFIIGTGFDNNWRVNQVGYEASDYPLLAAIAMTGVVGLLVFFPIYFLLYKSIFVDLGYLKKNQINNYSIEQYLFLVFIVYFIFEILNYTYWFLPVSLFSFSKHHKWYIILSFYFASRRIFYYYKKF